jgi:RHS repeat-associated protein
MTSIPKPADPTLAFTATYDAWNRLVKIVEGANTVAEYAYDGAKRRTVKKTYVGGVLDETRHFFYTEPSRWQILEERIGSSSDPQRHFTWGVRYADDLILRDRDTNSDGSLDERLYGLQDANWNLTAVANNSGIIQERFGYDSYGTAFALTDLFAPRASSQFDWDSRFAGYRYDSESRFYLVRHRVFAPLIGWIQRDPLADSVNFYDYARSNPVGFTDPSGLYCWVPRDCEAEWTACADRSLRWYHRCVYQTPDPKQGHWFCDAIYAKMMGACNFERALCRFIQGLSDKILEATVVAAALWALAQARAKYWAAVALNAGADILAGLLAIFESALISVWFVCPSCCISHVCTDPLNPNPIYV